jgi:Domain of unknown function (DUF4398)
MLRRLITAAVVGAGLAGCASMPPPTEQMAVSRAALDHAQSAGAVQYASAEYDSARRKLDLATLAIRDQDYVRARRLAEQAEIDANLAQARAGAAQSEKSVAEIREAIRVLREELNRKVNPGG